MPLGQANPIERWSIEGQHVVGTFTRLAGADVGEFAAQDLIGAIRKYQHRDIQRFARHGPKRLFGVHTATIAFECDDSTIGCRDGGTHRLRQAEANWTLLSGETNQFLNPQNGGLYSVVVTNEYGCSDTASTDFVPTGIDEFELHNWNIFPNPNDGSYTLNFASTTNETIEMSLYSAFGDLVDLRTLNVHPGSQSFFISNQNLVAGVYYVMILSEKARVTKKLVVK